MERKQCLHLDGSDCFHIKSDISVHCDHAHDMSTVRRTASKTLKILDHVLYFSSILLVHKKQKSCFKVRLSYEFLEIWIE